MFFVFFLVIFTRILEGLVHSFFGLDPFSHSSSITLKIKTATFSNLSITNYL